MEYSKLKIISSSQLKKLSAEMFKKKPENEQQNVLKYEIGNNAKNLLKKKIHIQLGPTCIQHVKKIRQFAG